MEDPKEVASHRDNWTAEKRSAYLYRKLAQNTHGAERQLFEKLGAEADEQAQIWAKAILAAGDQRPFVPCRDHSRNSENLTQRRSSPVGCEDG